MLPVQTLETNSPGNVRTMAGRRTRPTEPTQKTRRRKGNGLGVHGGKAGTLRRKRTCMAGVRGSKSIETNHFGNSHHHRAAATALHATVAPATTIPCFPRGRWVCTMQSDGFVKLSGTATADYEHVTVSKTMTSATAYSGAYDEYDKRGIVVSTDGQFRQRAR